MEESRNFLEIERMGPGGNLIAAEIGQTRRRHRSLRGPNGQLRRSYNIITDLPSRNNLGGSLEGNLSSVNYNGDVQAKEILDHIENTEELMDDTAKSVRDRTETLREMPQSLTLKRTVRSKLIRTLERRGKKQHVSLASRVGYSLNVATIQVVIGIFYQMYISIKFSK